MRKKRIYFALFFFFLQTLRMDINHKGDSRSLLLPPPPPVSSPHLFPLSARTFGSWHTNAPKSAEEEEEEEKKLLSVNPLSTRAHFGRRITNKSVRKTRTHTRTRTLHNSLHVCSRFVDFGMNEPGRLESGHYFSLCVFCSSPAAAAAALLSSCRLRMNNRYKVHL